jgi:hypothetical protein
LAQPPTDAGQVRQHWNCVDQDVQLLARLPVRVADWAGRTGLGLRQTGDALELAGAGWSARVCTRQLNLAAEIDDLPLSEGALVTASALLDLVSAAWLDRLLRRCRDAGCALLFALTYDGRCELYPSLDGDAEVIALVNRHQRTDKGFGSALGPDAAAEAEARCVALGYRVRSAESDWRIGADAPALQAALIRGWHAAALELVEAGSAPGALSRGTLETWRAARLLEVEAGRSRLRVGHRDLLALP